jgi:hypothetical protein
MPRLSVSWLSLVSSHRIPGGYSLLNGRLEFVVQFGQAVITVIQYLQYIIAFCHAMIGGFLQTGVDRLKIAYLSKFYFHNIDSFLFLSVQLILMPELQSFFQRVF